MNKKKTFRKTHIYIYSLKRNLIKIFYIKETKF